MSLCPEPPHRSIDPGTTSSRCRGRRPIASRIPTTASNAAGAATDSCCMVCGRSTRAAAPPATVRHHRPLTARPSTAPSPSCRAASSCSISGVRTAVAAGSIRPATSRSPNAPSRRSGSRPRSRPGHDRRRCAPRRSAPRSSRPIRRCAPTCSQ